VSTVALLDVNVLVALFDPDHVHHELAHDWFGDQRGAGWATCALTENGLVRVLSHAKYGAAISRPEEIVGRLRVFCDSGHHVFWPDAVSLRDRRIFNPSFIRGHRQVSDIYLLGLATKMSGSLATFDRSIPASAVIGASRETLAVIENTS
jgi:toxin-antitoxin system PIN domain toxin